MEMFLRGALAMANGVAGLFFLRFWHQTRDRLFLIFGIAFWLLGLVRVLLAIVPAEDETRPSVYLLRLLAYLLILGAIADKNRAGRRSGGA